MKTLNVKGFQEIKEIGHGSYGHVYKALRLSDNEIYAVKSINVTHFNSEEISSTLNEIRIMASFAASPYILRFYEALYENKRLCIVTEYASLGDLSHYIERRKKKCKPLDENTIWNYFIQILCGLNELHSKGVIHRDLKSANILMTAPDLVKIGDLGISTVLKSTKLEKTQIGTPLYLAPEIWKKSPYNQKCDIWSLGILLYEMMYFCFPFPGNKNIDIARRVLKGKYHIPRYLNEFNFVPSSTQAQGRIRPPRIKKPVKSQLSNGKLAVNQNQCFYHYSDELIQLLKALLQTNPAMRPTTIELLNLPSIKTRIFSLNNIISSNDNMQCVDEQLLATIKCQSNLRNVNLPSPKYNQKQRFIFKPIEQRLRVKNGVPVQKQINNLNSPEMKFVIDHDWLAPTYNDIQFDDEIELNDQLRKEFMECSNKFSTPKRRISSPPKHNQNRAPRNYKAKKPLFDKINEEKCKAKIKRL